MATLNVEKYGEWITHNGKKYLLTNYRAVVNDFEQYGDKGIDLRKRFNTQEECEIIEKHFKVFLFNVDLPTRAQMVRHRVNWQEISRRYVSGKKIPFEFYVSEKIRKNPIYDRYIEHINDSVEIYNSLLEDGVKPEEARRIIPQACYTTAWCAMQPKQLENFLKLRLDSQAQKEIRLVAEAIQELLK